jgi:hypothetical protein
MSRKAIRTVAGRRAPARPEPVRCRRDEWYLARARVAGAGPKRAAVLVTFLKQGTPTGRRCVWLHAVEGMNGDGDLLGWLKTPPNATHMQVRLADPAANGRIAQVTLHHVAERDPQCHPLANVPRWSAYRSSPAIERVLLPQSLASLAEALRDVEVRILAAPRSLTDLRAAARSAACVIDPQWVTQLSLGLADMERLAGDGWVVVDLPTLIRLLAGAGAADVRLVTHAALHGLMSARVEYADVPTRGLAQQDVVPYSTVDARGRFCVRGIPASRSWRRYADETGFATLLSGETPWEQKHGDILSAMRAVGGGELLATDLPWLVAGVHGPPLAPRLATHLLRMHLAAPVADHLQYWTRWEDADTIVRDIAELGRRCAPLRAVRWASPDPALAHLGLALSSAARGPIRRIMFCTGRMDALDAHDGLPPEPMMIFMKGLAREARERTAWARQYLDGTSVTWQFDTADGLKYAANYEAAQGRDDSNVVSLRLGDPPPAPPLEEWGIVLADDEGLHGDRSLLFQDELTARLRGAIEAIGLPAAAVDVTNHISASNPGVNEAP